MTVAVVVAQKLGDGPKRSLERPVLPVGGAERRPRHDGNAAHGGRHGSHRATPNSNRQVGEHDDEVGRSIQQGLACCVEQVSGCRIRVDEGIDDHMHHPMHPWVLSAQRLPEPISPRLEVGHETWREADLQHRSFIFLGLRLHGDSRR